jgi:two-component system, NarL family, sensor histidine kinase UhpB
MPAEMAHTGHFDRLRAVAAVALAATLWLALPLATQAQTLVFAEALTAPDRGLERFPDNASSRSVSLPDDWSRSRPHERGPFWYRLRFDPGASGLHGPLGLYIEHVCASVEVHLNGQLLHGSASRLDLRAPDCAHPLLVALPPVLLSAGTNHLDLLLAGYVLEQVASRQRAAGLSAPLIGPYAQLQERQARDTLLAVTLPQLAATALLLIGVVVLVMSRWRARDVHLRYFGALSVVWSLVSASPWWHELPLPNYDRELLLALLLPIATLAAVQFLLHHARWRSRPLELALYAQCAAVPASLLLAGPLRVYPTISAWYALLALQVLAATAFYLWSTRRARRSDFWAMALLLGVAALMAALDWAAQRYLLPPVLGSLAPVGLQLALVITGLRLVQQYGRALQLADEVRQALEVRIREAGAEMEKNFAQMADQRVEQVTQRERKRIAADLHDDLGAKLLTIVHTSESERISTLAREALEEMRLSVRGLTGKPVKLIDALGDWRAEVVGRLSQTGVEGEWTAPAEELTQTLSSRAYVQTTRILREAVNNIIKHSGASRCSIRCLIDSGDFQLTIQDNGKGIPLELDGQLDRGHGMASMKHRAKQLHGQCLVESGPGFGTVIRLTLPLERHTTAA